MMTAIVNEGGWVQRRRSSCEKHLYARPRSGITHFCSHSIEEKLVTWPYLSARDDEK